MSGEFDDLKGRAKEAVGDITDNDDLKREGKLDQAGAKVKAKVEEAKDWTNKRLAEAKERARRD